MHTSRGFLALLLCFCLCLGNAAAGAGGKPLGILALAYGAHLNAADAFAGLSVFPGELVSTDEEGKAMVRIGASVATLSELSSATLETSGDGAHIDLVSGTVFLSSAEKNPLEAHAEDAMLWPHTNQATQAQIQIYAPKVLQVSARAGDLDISYHGEYRVLPAGQSYRIYLESDAESQEPAGAGGGRNESNPKKPGMSRATKMTLFILGAAGAGAAAWGIHDIIESHNDMESPAKP
jgi:hypothetical protein